MITGAFFRRVVTSNKVRIGDRAGSDDGKGYRRFSVDSKVYRSHRLAWLYMFGHFPNGQLDYINRDRSDCRIANLREATPPQNAADSKTQKHNRSGLKGAYRHYHRRRAVVRFNGKCVHLGTFDTAKTAHAAYCYVAKRLHGEFFHDGREIS